VAPPLEAEAAAPEDWDAAASALDAGAEFEPDAGVDEHAVKTRMAAAATTTGPRGKRRKTTLLRRPPGSSTARCGSFPPTRGSDIAPSPSVSGLGPVDSDAGFPSGYGRT